ncbi:BAG family molecular chaperone regulator 6 [Aristolochia californica]|uniref:BAG family molecular chaperone regulator 6 n=1 Tax=Aristolochia californica TaxID=171875 RepID=UPI0035E30722
MDSYQQPLSDQRNYMFFPYYQYPPNPHQMKVETPRIPMNAEPSFYGGSYCYPPPGCHTCCNCSYSSPGYYGFRPPHISPLPIYHCGPHHSYPEPYPAYVVPPYYSAEVPRFEYDKNAFREHCCGCPNHTCNRKTDNTVKTEEELPKVKLSESETHKPRVQSKDSSFKLQNYSCPNVWIPPDYMRDKEALKSSDAKSQTGNEWLPFDENSRYLKQGGEKKKNQNQQNLNQFPFPLIWLPGFSKPQEVEEESGVTPGAAEEPQSKIKVMPLKFFDSDDHRSKPGLNKEDDKNKGHSEAPSKEIKPKVVLVKEGKEENEVHSEVAEKKTKTKSIPVKHIKKSSEAEVKKQPTSPGKASKLPPIRLRVDPSPKKKNGNGNGSLRSPSPPASRNRAELDMSMESVDKHKMEHDGAKPVEAHEKKHQHDNQQCEEAREKTIEVVKVPLCSEDSIKKTLAKNFGTSAGADSMRSEESEQNKVTEKHKTKEKILSATDAAIRIQSAYRGYEVRKWESVKKLRQIMRVRDQLDDVRNRIKDLETSSWSEQDQKQKIAISEKIMGLLLQLDTIQSLHSSVRDVRKTVARELTCLQERLDSLVVLTATSKTRMSESGQDEKPADAQGQDAEESTASNVRVEGAEESERSARPDFKMEEPLLDKIEHLVRSQEDTVQISVANKGETQSDTMEQEEPEAGVKGGASGVTCENATNLPSRIERGLRSEEKGSEEPEITQEASDLSTGVDATQVAPMVLMLEDEVSDLGRINEQEGTLKPDETMNRDNAFDKERRLEGNSENMVPVETPVAMELPTRGSEYGAVEQAEMVEAVTTQEADLAIGGYPGKPLLEEGCSEGLSQASHDEQMTCSGGGFESVLTAETRSGGDFLNAGTLELVHSEPFVDDEDKMVVGSTEKVARDGSKIDAEHCSSSSELLPKGKSQKMEEVISDNYQHEEAAPDQRLENEPVESLPDAGVGEDIVHETYVNKQESDMVSMDDLTRPGFVNSESNSESLAGNRDPSVPSEKEEAEAIPQANTTQPYEFAAVSESHPMSLEHKGWDLKSALPAGDSIPGKRDAITSEEVLVKSPGSIVDENEKLRELVEKLITAGKNQLKTISDLNGRVRDLERHLSKKERRITPSYGIFSTNLLIFSLLCLGWNC